jgi:hypothetical protein
MSCDYAVWHTNALLSVTEAAQLYNRLCEGDTSGVVPHPGIDAFYKELTGQHPEINDIQEDQVNNTDLCPWSIAFDRSEGHIIMCCVWPKADYVGELISSLATKHGLTLYDPQSEKVCFPGELLASKPWWKLW